MLDCRAMNSQAMPEVLEREECPKCHHKLKHHVTADGHCNFSGCSCDGNMRLDPDTEATVKEAWIVSNMDDVLKSFNN